MKKLLITISMLSLSGCGQDLQSTGSTQSLSLPSSNSDSALGQKSLVCTPGFSTFRPAYAVGIKPVKSIDATFATDFLIRIVKLTNFAGTDRELFSYDGKAERNESEVIVSFDDGRLVLMGNRSRISAKLQFDNRVSHLRCRVVDDIYLTEIL
jgi:hypothetical protein